MCVCLQLCVCVQLCECLQLCVCVFSCVCVCSVELMMDVATLDSKLIWGHAPEANAMHDGTDGSRHDWVNPGHWCQKHRFAVPINTTLITLSTQVGIVGKAQDTDGKSGLADFEVGCFCLFPVFLWSSPRRWGDIGYLETNVLFVCVSESVWVTVVCHTQQFTYCVSSWKSWNECTSIAADFTGRLLVKYHALGD